MPYKCDEFAIMFGKWKRAIKTKDRWKLKISKHTASCFICQNRINHKLTLAELRVGKKRQQIEIRRK
jgi:hypothetical protein